MPEGPETHRRAEELRRALVGDVLTKLAFVKPELKRYEKALRGKRVLAVTAHGKALLTEIEGGRTIYTHSHLFGFWRIDDGSEAPKSDALPRLVLQTRRARAQLFATSAVGVYDTATIDQHPFLRKLGPDVIDPATTVRDMKRQLDDARFSKKPLAALLLDQAFAAGMGNYLRSDVLYAARIAPTRTPASLDADERTALAKALLDVPRRSFKAQLRGLDDPKARRYRFLVFEREGEVCKRDGGFIEQTRLAGRRLYWCPGCQR